MKLIFSEMGYASECIPKIWPSRHLIPLRTASQSVRMRMEVSFASPQNRNRHVSEWFNPKEMDERLAASSKDVPLKSLPCA